MWQLIYDTQPTRASTHHPPILQQRSLTYYMHMARTLLRPIAAHVHLCRPLATGSLGTHAQAHIPSGTSACLPHTELPGSRLRHTHMPFAAASDCGPRASLSLPCHQLTWHTCTGTHTKRHMGTCIHTPSSPHVLYAHGPHAAAYDCGPCASLSPPCHQLTWHMHRHTYQAAHRHASHTPSSPAQG